MVIVHCAAIQMMCGPAMSRVKVNVMSPLLYKTLSKKVLRLMQGHQQRRRVSSRCSNTWAEASWVRSYHPLWRLSALVSCCRASHHAVPCGKELFRCSSAGKQLSRPCSTSGFEMLITSQRLFTRRVSSRQLCVGSCSSRCQRPARECIVITSLDLGCRTRNSQLHGSACPEAAARLHHSGARAVYNA